MGPASEEAPCEGLTCENPVRLTGTGEGQIQVYDPKADEFKAVCGKAFDKTVSDECGIQAERAFQPGMRSRSAASKYVG